MKYYFLSFIFVLLLQCRPKEPINPARVYPSGIQLRGISGELINLSWQVYGGYNCGWECIPDEDDYEHITPDYFEIYTGTSKNNLRKYKIVSGKIGVINEVFPDNQSIYVQIKAIYAAGAKEVSSNVIMVSSDKIPQAQKMGVVNKGYTFNYQGDLYSSFWTIRATLLTTSKAILVGKNSKNEYGTWFRDFLNNKQLWLWNNITSATWSPDNKKAILSKLIEKKTGSIYELYMFDSETLQLTSINFSGQSAISTTWSPDAKFVAFCVTDSLSNYTIYSRGTTSADLVKLFETKNNIAAFNAGTQNLEGISGLKWVQDEILFHKTDNYIKDNQILGETQIYSLNINSKTISRASDFEENDWREISLGLNPNQTKIAFISRRSGYLAIWIKDLEKKRSYQISNQICLPCNFSFEQWVTNSELIYSTSNSNTEEFVVYKVQTD